MQFPPDEFVKAHNAWLTSYNNYQRKLLNCRYCCLCQDNDCDSYAVDSHSIPKKNLKYMSKDKKVYVLKNDFTNPFKMRVSTNAIGKTLTFKGFCNYHDVSLFEKIENSSSVTYDNNDIFLLAYRALCKEYADCRNHIAMTKWILENWNSNEKKKFDIAEAQVYSSILINAGKSLPQREYIYWQKLIQLRMIERFKCQWEKGNAVRRKKRLGKKIEQFNLRIKNKDAFQMHYVILENDNKIAFSCAIDMRIRSKDLYLYLISLPQKDYSQLIIVCSAEDYEVLKGYDDLSKLFSGDERVINNCLNELKDNIAIDGTDSLDEYSSVADSFLLEQEVPFVRIRYYKKRRPAMDDSVVQSADNYDLLTQ